MIRALTDPDRRVRGETVEALLQDAGNTARPLIPVLIERQASDPDAGVRVSLLRLLARIEPNSTVTLPTNLKALGDASPEVRATAARLLALPTPCRLSRNSDGPSGTTMPRSATKR